MEYGLLAATLAARFGKNRFVITTDGRVGVLGTIPGQEEKRGWYWLGSVESVPTMLGLL